VNLKHGSYTPCGTRQIEKVGKKPHVWSKISKYHLRFGTNGNGHKELKKERRMPKKRARTTAMIDNIYGGKGAFSCHAIRGLLNIARG